MGRQRLNTLCWGAGLAAVFALLAGCGNPLYPKDLPRSPYERYMVLREDQRLLYKQDESRDDPALRQRLAPLQGPYEH